MDAEDLILLFSFLECFNCWRVRCGGLGRKSYLGQAEIACFYLFRNARVSTRLIWVIWILTRCYFVFDD